MRRLFKQTALYILLILANAFTVNSQQLQLTQLPILQDATWLITGITQDPQGYMWFGTKRTGLYRYDGYNTVSYKNQVSNPNSLSYDGIESLYSDKDGMIWIGTFGRGLDRFEPETGKFTHFRFSAADGASLGNDTVTCIMEDNENFLWLGTYGGISRMDKKTGKFINYRHNDNDVTSLSCNQVRAIYQDKQGTIWVGTGSGFYENTVCKQAGLNRFDKTSGRFTHYFHDPDDPNSLIDNRVRVMFEDRQGTFYVGTAGDGLHTLDRRTGKFTRQFYDASNPGKLSRPPVRKNIGTVDDHITFINEDATGVIWIGTFNGINRYDPVIQKTEYIPSFNNAGTGVTDNIGWTAFSSSDGILWFSALGTGNLYHVDPFLKKIEHFDIGDQVNCIYKESTETFWIGTQLTGLIRKNRINGTQKVFPFSSVTAIKPSADGQLWVGTIDGLYLFNPETETSTPFSPPPVDSASKTFIVSSLVTDHQNNLWIGTARGLSFLDVKTRSFIHYNHSNKDTSSLSDISVTSVLEDKQGRLWVGTHPDGGVNFLNKKTGKFKHYLRGRGITGTIYQDAANTIWVGTHEGLYRYDEKTDLFTQFVDPTTGASLGYILTLIEDDQNNLWIVTGEELMRLNDKRNQIVKFGKNEGVKPNTGYWGNFIGGDKKEVFFGDQSGYYSFNPAALSVNTRPPKILLTDFSLNSRKIKASLNNILNQPDSQAQEIDLKYNENVFSFNAVAIHYSNTAGNRFIYRLDGYDESWREAGVGQRVYYFNVPPGKYTLRIKAANGNGIWAYKNVVIKITPPWWQTWWAYTLIGVLFITGIWLFISYRSRNLIKEKSLLEEQVNLRTKEVVRQKEEISAQRDRLKEAILELQNTQTQLVQREKMASLGELTAGIAHEIQNPLNFVKNFSELNMELLTEIDSALEKGDTTEAKELAADIKQNLEKITHHGKRADSIVKGMLHHSRSSSDTTELTDINDLVDECLRLTYHGLRAKDKTFNAAFKTDFDDSIDKISIIPQDIGRVFLNLFTNAFYSVSEKNKQKHQANKTLEEIYEPMVTASTKRLIDVIEISIRDNGLGIPQKVLDKIYQPFFTTKPTGQGTGLGLSLSYDIIKAHGGDIKVNTVEGEFAEFIIHLPAS